MNVCDIAVLCILCGIWWHLLRRNCLVKHVMEGKIERAGRRRRRRKRIMNYLRETRGYCKLKAEVLDRTLLRTRFRRLYLLFTNN
jgi:hypothetical protein